MFVNRGAAAERELGHVIAACREAAASCKWLLRSELRPGRLRGADVRVIIPAAKNKVFEELVGVFPAITAGEHPDMLMRSLLV